MSGDGDGSRILSFAVTDAEKGMTIRSFLREKLCFSAHQISRLKFQAQGIRIDGRKAYVNHVLSAGEVLTVGLTEQVIRRETEGGRKARVWEEPDSSLARTPLRVLYEDADLIIVDKPAGIVVHPSPGHYRDTLANQVAAYLGAVGTELDIRVTGRLDKETSGIVTFARNTETAAMIQRQREAGTAVKTYLALAEGFVESESGTVDTPLRGKSARTFYKVMQRTEGPCGEPRTLLACRIEHGRMHQIRMHMEHIGHPLVGDPLYGAGAYNAQPEREPVEPMGLHAWKLVLLQPFSGDEIRVEAEAPAWADIKSGEREA